MDSEQFEKVDFRDRALEDEYEYCEFKDCVFSEMDLSSIKFLECGFEGCDLSLAKLTDTCLRDVTFRNCKMLGLHFDECNPLLLAFNFQECNLNMSSFFQLSLKKTTFQSCSLQEVDFSGCDLMESSFSGSDLTQATFDQTNLEKVDFQSAMGFIIDPEKNRLKKAKFERDNLMGLLAHLDIKIH